MMATLIVQMNLPKADCSAPSRFRFLVYLALTLESPLVIGVLPLEFLESTLHALKKNISGSKGLYMYPKKCYRKYRLMSRIKLNNKKNHLHTGASLTFAAA